MGIKNIKTLIKRSALDAFIEMSLKDFAGKRIIIDAWIVSYAYMAVARKKVINKTNVLLEDPDEYEITREWLIMVLNFIFKLLGEKITPVMVFDGTPHMAKDKTRKDRRVTREKYRTKVEEERASIKNDPLENTNENIVQLRKALINYNTICKEEFTLLKTTLMGIGIPCRQAKYDGEQLCSMLCREQKGVAVYSTDTDNLAYNCPLLITKFADSYSYDDEGHRVSNLSCVRIDKVLEGLKLNETEFLDLCIMCGCDFNSNMPGYAVIKSYDLIKKHRSIDNLPTAFRSKIPILNHEECRNIFGIVPSKDITVESESSSFNINKDALVTARNHLETFNLGSYMEKLILLYEFVPDPEEGSFTFPAAEDATTVGGEPDVESATETVDAESAQPPPVVKKKIIVKKKVTVSTAPTEPNVVPVEEIPVESTVLAVAEPEVSKKKIIVKRPATVHAPESPEAAPAKLIFN